MYERSDDERNENRVTIPDALLHDDDLRQTLAVKVYRLLVSRPKSTIREIARALDCSERAVTTNLNRLEQKGWLERLERERGRPNAYNFPRLVETKELSMGQSA